MNRIIIPLPFISIDITDFPPKIIINRDDDYNEILPPKYENPPEYSLKDNTNDKIIEKVEK